MQIASLLNCRKNYSCKIPTNQVGNIALKNQNLKADTISFCSNMPLAKTINGYFLSGERHTFNRLNKLKPDELRLVKEAIDIIQKAKEDNKPFTTFANTLQCEAGSEYIAIKEFLSSDGARVNLRIVLDKDFRPTLSRTETYDKSITSWLKNGTKVLIDEIVFDNTSSTWVSKNKFEIINNEFGEPEKLIHAKPNSKYSTFYEITEYKFKDYSEDIDLMSEIKNGTIEDGKKLAWLEEKENSTTFYNEFSQNCTKTKRKYEVKYSDNGEILSTEYKYQIKDDYDNELLNIDRKFIKNLDGSTTTIVGNKKYTATFNDRRKQVTVVDDFGNKTKLPYVGNAYELYKNLPADIALSMAKNYIQRIDVIDNPFDSSIAPNGIGYYIKTAIDSYEALTHEIGHALDNCNSKLLLDNEEIVDMYNAEWEIFKENNPEQSGKILQYFSQKSASRRMRLPHQKQKSDGGLGELVAETYLLMNYFGLETINSKRTLALVQNFPNTIALAAKNIQISTSQ